MKIVMQKASRFSAFSVINNSALKDSGTETFLGVESVKILLYSEMHRMVGRIKRVFYFQNILEGNGLCCRKEYICVFWI